MKPFFCVAFFLLFTFTAALSQVPEADSARWITNDRVSAIVRSGNTVYLAGSFTHIGPNTGAGVLLNVSDGKLAPAPLLQVDGMVSACIPDGRGGWFIGGLFNRVQGEARYNLAHILRNGTLDKAWKTTSGLGDQVFALALAGNVLYVGGRITALGSQYRSYVGSLHAFTAELTDWKPIISFGVDHVINAIAVAGNTVYVGGSFSTVNGQPRNNIAAIDAVTGQLTAWNPNASHPVSALVIAGNAIYAGGAFTTMGGQARGHLAAVDLTTGQPTGWNPDVKGQVNALAVAGNVLYAGGSFFSVGGQPRSCLAAIDLTTGRATTWNPGASGQVHSLAVAGNVVYAGGAFTAVGGQTRNNLAAIDATAGRPTAWDPDVVGSGIRTGTVYALAAAGSTVFAGGAFTSVNGQRRNSLAAVDAATGQATDWNPKVHGAVYALSIADNTLYAGGSFSTIGNQRRTNIAAIDLATGQPTAWNPGVAGVDQRVLALAVAGNVVYAGGGFTDVGGQTRNSIAAIDATTGRPTAWNPGANGIVTTIAVAGNVVYAGGDFTTVGGQTRNHIAAIDVATGQPTAWNPDADEWVITLAASGTVVYAGGIFNTIGGQRRPYLAAIDAATGKATAWNASAKGPVHALTVAGNVVYADGRYTFIDAITRSGIMALDTATGKANGWRVNFGNEYTYGEVNAIAVAGNTIHAGGNFYTIRNRVSPYFATFSQPARQPNYVTGLVYEDTNGDCVRNAGEKGLAGVVVASQPGDYFAYTDSLGRYSLTVDTGSYTIRQVIPADKSRFTRQTCPTGTGVHTVRLTGYKETLSGIHFANQITPDTPRPYLTIHVASTRRRRCFASTTTVAYLNTGNAPAAGAKVYVQLPPYVVPKSTSLPFTRDKDQHYVFDVGTLAPDASGLITIEDSVVCNNPDIRGLTQCTKAWITPANATTPAGNWDKSDAGLKAACLNNGRVRLGIYNAGAGNMADSSAFRILLDAQLAFAGNYKLAKGDSLILQVPANGRTVRLEADQRPGHPTKQSTNITLEVCGTKPDGTVSKGFVAQLPQDDAEPEVAVECLPIIDSFDPNDKAVSPQGVTDEKYTSTGEALDYVIRFQNTGTDVAYRVVVVDTLSEHLDISTLRVGAVSHAYKMTVTGKGRPVLTFTFDNIMLPDSNANEPKSHGLIQFGIKPKADLPAKTRVENFADIFFDYNEPVRTNTTRNTIYDVPPVVVEAVRLDRSIVQGGVATGVEPVLASLVRVFPNPTPGKVVVVMPAGFGASVQIGVYDALGRAVCTRSASLPATGERKVELDLSAQPAGVFVLKLQTPRGVVTRRIVRTGGK